MSNALDISAEERLRNGKTVLVPTIGDSMRPFIQGGRDKVLVRKQEEIRIGDIVMVPYCGMVISHRVYAIKGTKLILMGDGKLEGTEVVDKSEVWGTIVDIIKPNGRHRKPSKAWLWRKLLPVRKYLLKIYRSYNKLINNNI